jgi:hypothetical protein
MAGEIDEPDGVTARLEAALERIAAAAARRAGASEALQSGPVSADATQSDMAAVAAAPEIAARFDGLIERLRGALAVRPG